MTATLALPPVLAAAVVNGLCNVVVLNGVPCPGFHCHQGMVPVSGQGSDGYDRCEDCGGSGTVAPSVEPGQRIAIAATREVSRLTYYGEAFAWRYDLVLPDTATTLPLHPGHVVGSAVATTPALPIVDGHEATNHLGPMIAVLDGGRLLMLEPGMSGYEDTTTVTDLTAARDWLGDPVDLVGKWAVLLGDAATTEQRCPTCWGVSMIACDCGGSTLHMGHPCPTCNRERTCPPVPLPDGFDPEPYTLTELELT